MFVVKIAMIFHIYGAILEKYVYASAASKRQKTGLPSHAPD